MNGAGRRTPRKPQFLSDFKMSPDGQKPWKEYASEKNPQTVEDKYLVAAGWLTLHGGAESFRIDHLFTCFRGMEWDGRIGFLTTNSPLESEEKLFRCRQKKLLEADGPSASLLSANCLRKLRTEACLSDGVLELSFGSQWKD